MNLQIAASPHLKGTDSTERIMWTVVITLLPVVVGAVWFFGLGALLVVACSNFMRPSGVAAVTTSAVFACANGTAKLLA